MHYSEEPKFKAWKAMLADSGCSIDEIEPISLLSKRNGELLFGVFKVSGTGPDGKPLLPYAVVRGNAVVVVPYAINDDTDEEKFCMIYQPRTGNGKINLEFPAGMLDRTIADPVAVAVRELEEETGLTVPAQNMFPLWDKPLFTSVGLQDEAILFYGCVLHMNNSEFRTLEGRRTGEASEGENITVTLKTRFTAEQELCSTQVLLGIDLFERACQHGTFG